MSFESNIALFFENLPSVPLRQIANQLEFRILIKLSILSEKWINAMPNAKYKHSKLKWDVERSEIYCRISQKNGNFFETTIRFFDTKNQNRNFETGLNQSINVFWNNWNQFGNGFLLNNIHEISRKFSINLEFYEAENSNWMTKEDLIKIKCFGNFGKNHFVSEDFNYFLRKWKSGEDGKCGKYMEFPLEIENQKITINDILKGIEFQRWNPGKRSRKFVHFNKNREIVQPPLDLANGFDIFREADELICTVHLTETTLYIIFWHNPFEYEYIERFFTNQVIDYNRKGNFQASRRQYLINQLRILKEDSSFETFEKEYKKRENYEK